MSCILINEIMLLYVNSISILIEKNYIPFIGINKREAYAINLPGTSGIFTRPKY